MDILVTVAIIVLVFTDIGEKIMKLVHVYIDRLIRNEKANK